MKFAATGLGFALASALALGIGGCSNVDFSTYRGFDISNNLRLPSMSAPVPVEVKKPVTAEDLVDGDGRCASAPMASVAPETPAAAPAAGGANADPVTTPVNPAIATGGVALGMTECDVVKRAGPPEKVVIGTNEKAERTVVLTYLHSVRSGTYSFNSGRLVTIERVDEPPPPPKSVKPKNVKPKPKLKPAAT